MCATKEENAPWLAIDYGTDVLVERVEIFNRINCCGDRARNIDVYISNALPTSANEMYDEGGPRFGHYDGPGEDGEHIIIPGEIPSVMFRCFLFKSTSQDLQPLADM